MKTILGLNVEKAILTQGLYTKVKNFTPITQHIGPSSVLLNDPNNIKVSKHNTKILP